MADERRIGDRRRVSMSWNGMREGLRLVTGTANNDHDLLGRTTFSRLAKEGARWVSPN